MIFEIASRWDAQPFYFDIKFSQHTFLEYDLVHLRLAILKAIIKYLRIGGESFYNNSALTFTKDQKKTIPVNTYHQWNCIKYSVSNVAFTTVCRGRERTTVLTD